MLSVNTKKSVSSFQEIPGAEGEDEEETSSDTNNMPENRASEVVKPPASTTGFSSRKRPATNMDPPRTKVFKMEPNKNKKPTRFESAVDKLHSIAQLNADGTEDEYTNFGMHIASQMRKLPTKSFILLQSKIQNLITAERLASLNDQDCEPLSVNVLNPPEPYDTGLLTTTSNSTSNTDYNDMYSEQSINNTCLELDDPPTLDVLSKALVNLCPLDEDANMD